MYYIQQERMMNRGRAFIGTSNVIIPGNKSTFPENFREQSRLHYYSTLFNTVEINSCFYKTPLKSTFEKWTREVGSDFQFSLKLSKEISHSKELKFELGYMEKFMSSAAGTNEKKGCLLIQFPGKITLDFYTRVERILSHLTKLDAADHWRKAVEFRHQSWYTGETDELLQTYKAAYVIHDIAKGKLQKSRIESPFIYQRFHGPEGNYRGSYNDNQLRQQAHLINEWIGQGKFVYSYFNNTLGNGFENARTLQSLVFQEKGINFS